MTKTQNTHQYKDSRNLQARQGLHAKYATRDWFGWVADHLKLSPNISVLDVGCGAGWFWSSSRVKVPQLRLTLVDSSPSMVTEAVKGLLGKSNFNDVNGYVADAQALPFEDQSFDMVVAMHMLYHVPNQDKALAEIARVLKPGGTAAVTTNGNSNMRAIFDLRRDAFDTTDTDPAVAAFSSEKAKTLLGKHFDTVTLDMFEDSYAIDDKENVLEYLISFPPGNHASDAQLAKARALIATRLGEAGSVMNVKRESALICGR